MRQLFKGICQSLWLFVSSLLRIRKERIGLSLIIANNIDISGGVGWFNIIVVNELHIKKNARIGHLNFIKGYFNLKMDERSEINLQNKISRKNNPNGNYCLATVYLNRHAKIGVKHLIDATSNITIGENSMLAGAESQIWTHGFYFSKEGDKVVRIDGDVEIGHNCYIGARCVITAGVTIGDCITVGAATCVSKSIKQQGIYVSQPLRFIPFDPDEAMKKLQNPVATVNWVNIYKKQ